MNADSKLAHRLQNADLVIDLGEDGTLASMTRNSPLLQENTLIKSDCLNSFKTFEDKPRSQILIAPVNNDSEYSLNIMGETSGSEDSRDSCHTGELETYKYYFNAAPKRGWLLFITALSVGVASKVFMCKSLAPFKSPR